MRDAIWFSALLITMFLSRMETLEVHTALETMRGAHTQAVLEVEAVKKQLDSCNADHGRIPLSVILRSMSVPMSPLARRIAAMTPEEYERFKREKGIS
jgi:hypothetical protein